MRKGGNFLVAEGINCINRMQVEIGPVDGFDEPREALFRISVSMIRQSTKESAPTNLIDEKEKKESAVDNEEDEPEPEPKPLIPAQVPSLAAKESRTSMDDVRLVAIPSPKVSSGKSNQSAQGVERTSTQLNSADSASVHSNRNRSWSQDFEENRLVKFEENESRGTTRLQRKISKSKKPKKSILKRTASPSTRIRLESIQEEIVKATKELSQGSIMVKYSSK
jgi:hypothetical protein